MTSSHTNRISWRCCAAVLATLLAVSAARAPARENNVCDDLVVRSDDKLNFSDTEKRFLCGDRKNPSWSEPPESETKTFLVSFLQSRGYFQPKFSRDGEDLVVDVGEKSRIKVLGSSGEPPELDFSRFWVPGRRPLRPSLLDEYEGLVQGRIESEGYPCPKVKATANAENETLKVTVQSGPRQRISQIKEESVAGLRPNTLRRYMPFEEGDWFDGDLVAIANERLKAEGMLSSSYFVSTCGQEGAVVEHRAATGPPRRMTVGFGVNTETFFLVKSTYRNSRVDENASRFDAVLTANYFKQRVETSFDWYFRSKPSSLHFKPAVSFERRAEKSSEVRTTTASWHLGDYGDGLGHYWRAYVGPNLNLVRTLRGRGPQFARIVEMEASGQIVSHDHEFYRGTPRTGHLLDWRYTTASEHALSTLSVQTFSLEGERLFNWASLEPPLVVLGLRGGLRTTLAEADADLPDQYLYYLGGSGDVRGFARRSVPSLDEGARSAAYLGTEARLVSTFPFGLQPLVFIDGGKVGGSAFAFEHPLYYSPGLGLRWQSPFGSLRGSVARGFVAKDDIGRGETVNARWTAFVSFGEEF